MVGQVKATLEELQCRGVLLLKYASYVSKYSVGETGIFLVY